MFCCPISDGIISVNLATQNATITLQFENIESAQAYYRNLLKDCPATLTSATLLAQISDDILIQTFKKLSYIDRHNVSKVSKKWRRVSLDNKLGLLEWVQLVKTVMPKLSIAVLRDYWDGKSSSPLDLKTHYITFPINSDQKINIVTEEFMKSTKELEEGTKEESIKRLGSMHDPHQYVKPNESYKYDVCIVEIFKTCWGPPPEPRLTTVHFTYWQKKGIYTIVQNSSLPMDKQNLIQEVEKFVNEFAKDILVKRGKKDFLITREAKKQLKKTTK